MNPVRILFWPYHKLNQTLVKIPFFDRLRTELKEIRKANLTKTLYFNFKMFPFHIARKLPVWIYGKVKFYSLEGEIRFNCSIRNRLITIGKTTDYFGARYISTIGIHRGGIWIINGACFVSEGVLIDIKGTLVTGYLTALGTASKIRCHEYIELGDGVGITEECQVFDTIFHFIQNVNTGEIRRMKSKVIIGDLSWVGNRTTISKGCILPPYTIVCSNSLVNRDFSGVTDQCPMIGGIPARLIGSGNHRIYNFILEKELWDKFGKNPDLESLKVKIEPLDKDLDLYQRNPENW